MEQATIKQHEKGSGKIKHFLKTFLFAVFLAVTALIVCSVFLVDVNKLTGAERAFAAQINSCRVVIGFGILSVIATIILIKQRTSKLLVMFIWTFWLLILFLNLAISNFQLDIMTLTGNTDYPLNAGDIFNKTISILPYLIWILGIYYCRKLAKLLNRSTKIATLAGIFLPILSILFYLYFLYQKKEKQVRIKMLKITTSVIIFLLVVSAGFFYYFTGTPEYSLYKLKKAIQYNNSIEIEKYLAVEEIAQESGETKQQLESYLKDSDVSILQIMEENPDHTKTASKYLPTGLTGKNIKSVSLSYSSSSNPGVYLKFDTRGTALFSKITKDNIGKRLAFFLNGVLISYPNVNDEISNGEVIISGYTFDQTKMFAEKIKEGKESMLDCLKIMNTKIDRDSATITLSNIGDGTTGISMNRMQGRYWKVVQADILYDPTIVKLPAPEGARIGKFNWKYRGKSYSMDQNLYESFYKTYKALPVEAFDNGESAVGWQEKNNNVFLTGAQDDNTLKELAFSLSELGNKNNLNDDQLVEMVTSFVQTIPYDTEKFNNRQAGLNGNEEKPTYPYEVLYDNKGVCQDKSYLAYLLLKDLGYGVSIFIFPEDHHMAVGIKCPMEYSQYNSGYCFLESTALGNKIGIIPGLLPKSNIATSDISMGTYGDDNDESQTNPLGKVEITNVLDGKEYAGIMDTVVTQKEIDNLRYTIRQIDNELNSLRADLDSQNDDIGKMVDKLDSLAKSAKNGSMSAYNDYNNLYSKYKKTYSSFEKDRKSFNARIATRNQINTKYNNLLRSFYQ